MIAVTPLNMTRNPVDTTAVRYLVDNLEGELQFPQEPEHLVFFIAVLQKIQDFVHTYGVEALRADPRGSAPLFGAGSALDDMSPQDMAETVAASHAHTFNGELIACTLPADTSCTPHQLAIRELLLSIEQDAWSVISYGLEESVLVVPDSGYLTGVVTVAG